MVREVSGVPMPESLAKNAPVRASGRAPSMAKVAVAGLAISAGETPSSTRTPSTFPARSTMAIMASRLADAAAARSSSVPTSPGSRVKGSLFGGSAPGAYSSEARREAMMTASGTPFCKAPAKKPNPLGSAPRCRNCW